MRGLGGGGCEGKLGDLRPDGGAAALGHVHGQEVRRVTPSHALKVGHVDVEEVSAYNHRKEKVKVSIYNSIHRYKYTVH
jgi:hypothetical protein